jgi:hypothetical protein
MIYNIRLGVGLLLLLAGCILMGLTGYLSFFTGSWKGDDAGVIERLAYWMFLNFTGPIWPFLLGIIITPKYPKKER